jgi:predicted PurR-regulated permease PerM
MTGSVNLLRRAGGASWAALGIILLAVAVGFGASVLSGVLIPLAIAVFLSTVLEPVVSWLQGRGLSRTLAAAVVLVLTLLVIAGLAVMLVRGFAQQIPEISQQLLYGWQQFLAWLRSLDLHPEWLEQMRRASIEYAEGASRGAAGFVTSAVFATISLSMGIFFGTYFLFFLLRDGQRFPGWVASISGQDPALTEEIHAQVQTSLRGYFSGTALTALITAPFFALPLLIVGVPLVVPTMILYFVLSFIPFVGAWITGAFAVLIAFGFGGPSAALIVAVGLIISNGSLQNVVSAWALGSSLSIHPVTVLLSTMAGGAVAGALGMVLGPPLAASVKRSVVIVREHNALRAPPPTHPEPVEP